MHSPGALLPREDISKNSKQEVSIQWQIQDFPEGGANFQIGII